MSIPAQIPACDLHSRRGRSQGLLVSRLVLCVLCVTLLVTGHGVQGEPPADLKPIGGHWYVKGGQPPLYFYQDGDRYLDLFSYHMRDSNKDGIPNLKITHDERYLLIQSQGYPNHPTAIFPNSGNPNRIRVQDFHFRLPLKPQVAGQITRVPMGPIGMAINGVVFFNPFEAGGMNAVEGYSEVWLDSCCGHPQQEGVYHYHKYPSCVKSPFPDDGEQHSPILGFAFDGFPLYGPYESKDTLAKDLTGSLALDACNGHQDEIRGYHYHVTPDRFPYIIGGYAGTPVMPEGRGPRNRGSQTGAIVDNSEGESRLEAVIKSVRPGTAQAGTHCKVQFELDPKASRHPLPPEAPVWVQIGPYEATKITRQGMTVEAEFDLAADAPRGLLLDCHLEFDPQGPGNASGRRPRLVYKRNNAFRIVDKL